MSRARSLPLQSLPVALALALGAWAASGCNVGLSGGSDQGSQYGSDHDGGGTADSDGGTRVIAAEAGAGALPVAASRGSVRCGAEDDDCDPDALLDTNRCGALTAADAGASADAGPTADAATGVSWADAGNASADATTGSPVKSNDDASVTADAALTTADAGAASSPRSCRVGTAASGVAPSCAAAGQQASEAVCTSPSDCAAGFDCVGSPGRCRHYCCSGEATCEALGAGTFCDVEPLVGGGLRVPVCAPLASCTLLAGDTCPSGKTCAIVKNDGTTSCVDVGSASLGAPCDTEQCAAGLTCLGAPSAARCYQLCRLTSALGCTDGRLCVGSSQLVTNNQIGLCQ